MLTQHQKSCQKSNYCQYCDKRFRVQSNMKVHEKTCELHQKREITKKLPKSKTLQKKNSKIIKDLKDDPRNFKNDPKDLKGDPNDIKYDPKDSQADPKDLKGDPNNITNNPHVTMNHPKDHKLYSCKYCPRIFKYFKHFKTHEETQACINVLFSCKQCGKKLSKKEVLKNHEMIHTGEKPFSCKNCNNSFCNIISLK